MALDTRLQRDGPRLFDPFPTNWQKKQKGRFKIGPKPLVRKEGLEPSWVTPPDPKSGASANSATFATFSIIQSGGSS